tara:strand:- start:23172 stop:24167 length:996 start_codon:yes stop_codon:yes gene_type:complete
MVIRDMDGEYHAFGRKADLDLWAQLKQGPQEAPLPGSGGPHPTSAPLGANALGCPSVPVSGPLRTLGPNARYVHPSGGASLGDRSGRLRGTRGAEWYPTMPPSVPVSGPVWNLKLEPGDAVDGEIYVLQGGAQDVKTAIKSGSGWGFVGWDQPFSHGHPHEFNPGEEGFQDRDLRMERLGLESPQSFGIKWSPGCEESLVSIMNEEANHLGIEGFVLKASVSHGWWRHKPIQTVDAFVTRILEGEGRLSGSLGSLVVSVYDETKAQVEISNVGTGFSDEQRAQIWKSRDSLMGSVIEVAYDCVQVGRLRFPRFIGWRDDKRRAECSLSQIK